MARLIDISKFDVFDFQLQEDQTLEFAYGAQWMLEQIDKEPIVDAIPRERIEQILENYKLRISPTVYYDLLADIRNY